MPALDTDNSPRVRPTPPPPPPPASATASLTSTPPTPERAPVDARAQADARQRAGGLDAARALTLHQSPLARDTARPPARPGVTDVGAMQPGELAALRSSTNPSDRRRAATIERAQTAYADHMRAGGRVVVSTSAANGGHPVVTLVPPGFDPTKPARVHTHYHGFHATVADPRGHSSGTTARIADVQRRDPQAVFVLPEAANARAGSYATDWSNVQSQARTTRDALRDAGIGDVGHRTVSAHSGGGAALARAMRGDGSGLQADRLELHDSLYGSERAVAAWARTPAGRAVRDVLYMHGTNTSGRDREIARAFGDRYRRIDVAGPDAHNRAVRDFMGR